MKVFDKELHEEEWEEAGKILEEVIKNNGGNIPYILYISNELDIQSIIMWRAKLMGVNRFRITHSKTFGEGTL